MSKVFELNYEVGDSELEKVYKHVNHADALMFLEKARLALLEHIGCSSPSLIAEGILPVITHIDVNYKREIFKGPQILTCEDGLLEGKSMVLTQRVLNERRKEAVVARVWSMFIGAEIRRAVPIPDRLVSAFSKFFEF